jgi:rhodanese-related sulfurtransferase
MTVSQFILYAIAALVFLIYIQRLIRKARMKEYSPKQVTGMLEGNSIVLLDVRTREEHSHQSIRGSIHIPVNELAGNLNSLEPYRQKEIVCYCHSGSRSLTAASILQKNGFRASNMKGGISEWNYQNLK